MSHWTNDLRRYAQRKTMESVSTTDARRAIDIGIRRRKALKSTLPVSHEQKWRAGTSRTRSKKCDSPTVMPRRLQRRGLATFRILNLRCGWNKTCRRGAAGSVSTPRQIPRQSLPPRSRGSRLGVSREKCPSGVSVTERRRLGVSLQGLGTRAGTGRGSEPLEGG